MSEDVDVPTLSGWYNRTSWKSFLEMFWTNPLCARKTAYTGLLYRSLLQSQEDERFDKALGFGEGEKEKDSGEMAAKRTCQS